MRPGRATMLFWAGLVVALSFIAAPVKFQAASLTRAVALDVGRHTFSASHLAQLCLAAIALWQARHGTWRAIAAATALLLVQMFVLMPILDERAAVVIAGGEPTGWSPHALYVVLELAKVVLLLIPPTINRKYRP